MAMNGITGQKFGPPKDSMPLRNADCTNGTRRSKTRGWLVRISNESAGVEIRPLKDDRPISIQRVFIDEARVSQDDLIGELNEGWRVASTTLMVERAGIGGATE